MRRPVLDVEAGGALFREARREMPLPPDAEYVVREFRATVNMSAEEIERWLQSQESRSAPDREWGQRVLELLRKPEDRYTDGDVADMQIVIDRVRELLALERPSEPATSRSQWRYALMNWGHDPLRDTRR